MGSIEDDRLRVYCRQDDMDRSCAPSTRRWKFIELRLVSLYLFARRPLPAHLTSYSSPRTIYQLSRVHLTVKTRDLYVCHTLHIRFSIALPFPLSFGCEELSAALTILSFNVAERICAETLVKLNIYSFSP